MNRFIIITVLFSIFNGLYAQNEVSESKRDMSEGMLNSYMIEFENVKVKEVEKEWKKFTKPYKGKLKYNKKTKEWYTKGANIPELGKNKVDLFAKILEDKNDPNIQTVGVFWFRNENGFIATNLDEVRGYSAKSFTTDFGIYVNRGNAQEVLDVQEKELSHKVKNLKRLEKDNDQYHKKIKDAEKLIEEMKQKIEQNAVDRKDEEAAIVKQKEIVTQAREKLKKF